MSAKLTLFVMLPAVAVSVIVAAPKGAAALAEKVTTVLPVPGAVMEEGAKLAVTPEGNPLAEKEIAELSPPSTAVERVTAEDNP